MVNYMTFFMPPKYLSTYAILKSCFRGSMALKQESEEEKNESLLALFASVTAASNNDPAAAGEETPGYLHWCILGGAYGFNLPHPSLQKLNFLKLSPYSAFKSHGKLRNCFLGSLLVLVT